MNAIEAYDTLNQIVPDITRKEFAIFCLHNRDIEIIDIVKFMIADYLGCNF